MSSTTDKSFAQVAAAVRRGATVVPLLRELPADTLTPVAAFLRLPRPGERSFLLESVEGGERTARYSFLGARPFEELTVRDGIARFRRGSAEGELPGCPFMALGQRLQKYHALPEPGLPPFCGGAVGHMGYEMVRHLEPSCGLRRPGGVEARLSIFGDVAAFDQVRHRLLLIANVIKPERGPLRTAYRRAQDALDSMEQRITRGPAANGNRRTAARRGLRPRNLLGPRAFCDGVRRLKRSIREGDIFQAVLSERFDVPLRCGPFDVYRRLRTINPSPYMFYIGHDADAILGASPETLVRIENGRVETRPIAGTRPRGADEEEDIRFERQLLTSVKERAEHLMLVDLGRNDVGRIARPGTVTVPTFMQVERYSHVMHIVSSVQGRLRRGATSWEAFAACFPAGTVSGAPKIRAMQLLGEIEPEPRGLYAGAVVYHDFHGNLDSAIAIRSLSARGRGAARRARVQAGAGIVADSRPAAELREVRAKAGAMLEAIRQAEENR
ncbi:MAG: chorismate-binding protein [Elusimicrobiota bacterium]